MGGGEKNEKKKTEGPLNKHPSIPSPYLAVVEWLRRSEVVDDWLVVVVYKGPEGVQLRARGKVRGGPHARK